MEEDKKIDYLKILYLLLIIIPTEYITLRLFPITEDLFIGIAIFLPMIVGYVLYGFGFSKLEKIPKILYLLSLVVFLISLLSFINSMTIEGGLDSVGQALGLIIIYRLSNIICRVLALLLLIITERKHIFKKKFLIPFFIIVAVIIIIVYLTKYISTSNYRENKDIKTLADFKNELDRRGLYTNDSPYKVFGINQNGEKELSFEYNSADQYPEFIFIKHKDNYSNDWIIYYVNGKISAAYGQFYVGFNGEEKILWEYPYIAVGEDDEVFTYNDEKDVIEKGNSIYYLPCKNCKLYIQNIRLCYGSNYCDLLSINYKKVEYINKNSLKNEESNYLRENSYKNWSY